MPDFDVIIVGAGPAGSACALTLARRGVNVLMLEKAKVPGERNMTGGVLYGDFGHYGMIHLLPEFETEAPVQRRIVSHEVVILDQPDWKESSFRYYVLSKNSLASKLGLVAMDFDTGHDYSVLRRSFDRWFANVAVEAGAMISTETTVEDLIIENGSVAGVRTTKESLRANLVVDCSGVTSTLVEKAGLRDNLVPRQLYHGIKRVYSLDESSIEERFRLKKGEGRAVFFIGKFMHRVGGGAFVYTNRNTLSIGVVASMDSMVRATTERFDEVGKLLDIQDEFEAHPMISQLLEGAELVEYSAHNVPKGYKCLLKRPYTDGFLVAGDALGAFVKVGPMIDGIRRAIASGIMAAEAYISASASGSFRKSNLSRYRDLLTPIYEDVNRSGRDSFISESSFVYSALPRLLFGIGLLAKKRNFSGKTKSMEPRDAIQKVQAGTSLLAYEEDKVYSHIKVDVELASKSVTKPWVPSCPVNCYTLLTPKGVFASYADLYRHNLASLSGGKEPDSSLRKKAFSQTLEDIAGGKLRFDHVACVACGTCGSIGPKEMVLFEHERDGHGVRYRYG